MHVSDSPALASAYPVDSSTRVLLSLLFLSELTRHNNDDRKYPSPVLFLFLSEL